ncbi:MAG: precorrin-3B C(17)-methyltransferase [Magnetococcales bacterium]|nr:precorrin-3B C(17)-methyltransferase [Magnetococcales bacterium]
MCTGKLMVIGIGPGAPDEMTLRARSALESADVIVGYKTYLALLTPWLTGKKVVGSGMMQELQRCAEALKRARKGERVALISSGDAGVYGMAGPVYELLLESGWRPDGGLTVEVIPGVTALLSCASRIGAPLTHDFCAISLSDLLTPWTVIEKRLHAAASADFVTALYNPKSRKRTEQIVQAQAIFLHHRTPDTPVAIVTAAGRERESTTLADLATMLTHPIGMQTTLLIGNSTTFVQSGVMVTPRGYSDKYDLGKAMERT